MSSFIAKLQTRLAKEESGFTLIELLIVLVIIGILLAIAVPSYLGFKDRASKSAAQANVRSAVPAVEAYYADHGNYTSSWASHRRRRHDTIGLAGDRRRHQARGRRTSARRATLLHPGHAGQLHYYKAGPAGDITTGACPKPTRTIARPEGARSNPRPLVVVARTSCARASTSIPQGGGSPDR